MSELGVPRSRALGEVVRRRVVRPRTVLLVGSAGVFMAFLDATIVTIAFPSIEESFPSAGVDGLSWVLNAYNIVFAAFLVAAGRAADLLGRKRMFEVGLVLFTAASALCALAPDAAWLIAARILQAAGAAIVVPASLALVLQAYPVQERRQAVALWAANAALAAGLGPSVGGVLVDQAGWRAAFLVNLPIGALALVAARRSLVESRAPGRRTVPDLPGALIFAAAVAALAAGILKGPDWGWDDGRVVGAFAMAVLLTGVFIRRSASHPSPLIDGALVRIRAFSAANGLMVLAAAAYFSLILNNVLFLTTVWGWSVLEAGFAMTPGPIVAAAVAGPVGRLAERVDARPVLAVGAGFWCLGAAGYLVLAGDEPAFLERWLPATVLAGIGGGICFPTLSAVAVAAAPGDRFATATALNSVSRQLGAALGVAILIALLGTPATALGDFQRGWVMAVGLFVALALGAALLGRIVIGAAPADLLESREADGGPVRGAGAAQPPPARAVSRPVLPSLNGTGSVAEFLRSVPMLSGAPTTALAQLARSATLIRLTGGEVLFREGDPGDSLYVVGRGRLEALHSADAGDQVVRVLQPGDVLGELALLAGGRRAATVRARRDTVLIRVEHDEFEMLLRESPELGLAVTRELARQIRDSRPAAQPGVSRARTFAVVALDARSDAGRFAADLHDALARRGRAALIGAEAGDRVDEPAELVDAHERLHDHVVLAAGPGLTGRWPEFCLRHADRIVALTTGGEVPDSIYWHTRLRGCDLVYVDEGRGEGISAWARVLQPVAHYRVEAAADWRQGVEAAARRLTGRSVGVVFSGGGARGFAHVGVIEELLAAGVRIDRVGGVSCGSWIGGMFALGMDADEIDARCYEEWVRRNPLSDYTLPRTSMIRGHRVRAVFDRNLPGLIEEMPRDYFCVSCDLVSGDLVVHRTGPLAVAAAASQCLPGLAPPLALDGRLLVDGGVRNNLPVDVMAAVDEGPVIAVDVSGRYESPAVNGRRPRRRARAAADALWDDDTPRPSVFETISRSIVLGSVDTEAAAERYADVIIRPIDKDVGMLEWHQLDRVRERGRRAAHEVLERTPAELLGL